ncbi:YlqD family protein [Litoribacterium kuwaitense]|uniref:YlqD family protein n=1 Tax=Litoribacterium kuwaitense TaxID=1398745 RepID=UPI001FE7B5DB|nr:YlqD family protein [Litoribacterium kuwaitense]
MIRKAVVKKVLTPDERARIRATLQTNHDQAVREYEQLKFYLKRSEHQKQTETTQRLRKELVAKEEAVESINFQMEQLDLLPGGTELKVAEVEIEQDIEVGMQWEDKPAEIIVEDGVIKDIR